MELPIRDSLCEGKKFLTKKDPVLSVPIRDSLWETLNKRFFMEDSIRDSLCEAPTKSVHL